MDTGTVWDPDPTHTCEKHGPGAGGKRKKDSNLLHSFWASLPVSVSGYTGLRIQRVIDALRRNNKSLGTINETFYA